MHQTVCDPIYCWDWVMSYLLFVKNWVTRYILYIYRCVIEILHIITHENGLSFSICILCPKFTPGIVVNDTLRANYIVSALTLYMNYMSQPLLFFNDEWRYKIILMKLVLTWSLRLHLYSSWVESNDIFISSLCWLHGVVHKQLISLLFHFIHL